MTPSDERLVAEYISRTRCARSTCRASSRSSTLISAAIGLHVILGIVQASLDVFLEAAAVKLSQAIFFSSMQTANPTSLRLAFVFVLIMLRVAAATLVFRVGWLSGVLTSAPSRHTQSDHLAPRVGRQRAARQGRHRARRRSRRWSGR